MDAIDQALDQFNLKDFEGRICDLSKSVPIHNLSSLSTKNTMCVSILDLDFDNASLNSHCVINRENFASFVEKVLYNCGISHVPRTIKHAKLLH